jgi:16S rRNA (adenine1518-N6/adenine1519-N6)-dimethyltransferase
LCFLADTNCHFKIPPTVFYPQPKVDSALVGLHFVGPTILRQRLAGVDPAHLRTIVTTSFGQRRKTIRNSLKKLALQVCNQDVELATKLWNSPPPPLPISVTQQAEERDNSFAKTRQLPPDWSCKRPEELTCGQFVELTRLFFGPTNYTVDNDKPLGKKVWRKLKHGMA